MSKPYTKKDYCKDYEELYDDWVAEKDAKDSSPEIVKIAETLLDDHKRKCPICSKKGIQYE